MYYKQKKQLTVCSIYFSMSVSITILLDALLQLLKKKAEENAKPQLQEINKQLAVFGY